MANLGTTQRITTTTSTPSSNADTDEPKGHHQRPYTDFRIYFPFNIPLSSETAAIRVIRNLANLGLYYTLFVWIILFITLIPRRKVSLIILVIMTYVTTIYSLLLRAYPNSVLLHRDIDKRFVLGFLVFATVVELILTQSGIHLAVTLACAVPLVLLHAVFWINNHNHYAFETEDASGNSKELAPLAGHDECGAEGLEIV